MKIFLATLYLFALTLSPTATNHPGFESYNPARIEWLRLEAQADLREDYTKNRGFSLGIADSGPETLTIYVRYDSDVDRTEMNKDIDAARKVIEMSAKSYEWDGWLRIKEDVAPFEHKP
jgi:hypothetical protein